MHPLLAMHRPPPASRPPARPSCPCHPPLHSLSACLTFRLRPAAWEGFAARAVPADISVGLNPHLQQVTKLNAISILSGLAVVVVNWLVTLAVRRVGATSGCLVRVSECLGTMWGHEGERWSEVCVAGWLCSEAEAVLQNPTLTRASTPLDPPPLQRVAAPAMQLTVLERWHTRTAGERCALLKLSLAYLGNAFVVPLLAAQFAGSSSSWCVCAGCRVLRVAWQAEAAVQRLHALLGCMAGGLRAWRDFIALAAHAT